FTIQKAVGNSDTSKMIDVQAIGNLTKVLEERVAESYSQNGEHDRGASKRNKRAPDLDREARNTHMNFVKISDGSDGCSAKADEGGSQPQSGLWQAPSQQDCQ